MVLFKGAAVRVSDSMVANHDRLVAVSVSAVRVRDAMVPVSGAGEPVRVAVVAVSVAVVAVSVALVAMSVAAVAVAVSPRRACADQRRHRRTAGGVSVSNEHANDFVVLRGGVRGRLHEGDNPFARRCVARPRRVPARIRRI